MAIKFYPHGIHTDEISPERQIDLTNKLIFFVSAMIYPSFTAPCRFIRMTNDMVHIVELPKKIDRETNRIIIVNEDPEDPRDEHDFHKKSIRAICDTIEEANMIFNRVQNNREIFLKTIENMNKMLYDPSIENNNEPNNVG
jgi:hypothetical protein